MNSVVSRIFGCGNGDIIRRCDREWGCARGRVRDAEEGSTTVEYSIGVVAAAGFAGLLVVILKSGAVKGLIEGIIQTALSL
ncbi:DUF4244 domain-containing protein [Schaalia sp. ZJ405]|uniref:DUF4244 domain-containing protein n=2 Tax=unclassified Schaalia TaxID=2691889 RepID=UPI0013EA4A3B|nr:DUF4244 domain-containing protein [Schaalia sp. ZJ405]